MKVIPIAIALAIVALLIGAQPDTVSGIASDDPVAPGTGVPASCDFVKIIAHPDPSVLLREFLERDASGEFLQGDQWFDGATECPGHEGAPDAFELIAGYDVTQMVVLGPSASATVRYHALGRVVASGGFTEEARTLTQAFTMHETRYGWRLAGHALNQRVLVTAPKVAGYLKPEELARAAALAAKPK